MTQIVSGILSYLIAQKDGNCCITQRAAAIYSELLVRVQDVDSNFVEALRSIANGSLPVAELARKLLEKHGYPAREKDGASLRRKLQEKYSLDSEFLYGENLTGAILSMLDDFSAEERIKFIADIGRFAKPETLLQISLEGCDRLHVFEGARQMGWYGGPAGMKYATECLLELVKGDDPISAVMALQAIARGWSCSLVEDKAHSEFMEERVREYVFLLGEKGDIYLSRLVPLGAALFALNDRVSRQLHAMLEHQDVKVQRAAGIGLHRLHGLFFVEILRSIDSHLRQDDNKAHQAFRDFADQVNPPTGWEAVVSAFTYPHPEVRRGALIQASAYRMIGAGNLFEDALIERLKVETDTVVIDALHWIAMAFLQDSMTFVQRVLTAYGQVPTRNLEALIDTINPDIISKAC